MVGVEHRMEALRLTGGGEDPLALLDVDRLVIDGMDDEQRAAELGDAIERLVLVEVVQERFADLERTPADRYERVSITSDRGLIVDEPSHVRRLASGDVALVLVPEGT